MHKRLERIYIGSLITLSGYLAARLDMGRDLGAGSTSNPQPPRPQHSLSPAFEAAVCGIRRSLGRWVLVGGVWCLADAIWCLAAGQSTGQTGGCASGRSSCARFSRQGRGSSSRSSTRSRRPRPPTPSHLCMPSDANSALEATQGQMDGFWSQLPFKRCLPEVASVGD